MIPVSVDVNIDQKDIAALAGIAIGSVVLLAILLRIKW